MPEKVKDLRYKAVSMLLRNKQIKKFEAIFKYIPPTVVAMDLRTNNNRMKRLIKNPGGFKLVEIQKLADLFEYDYKKMVALITNSYKPE